MKKFLPFLLLIPALAFAEDVIVPSQVLPPDVIVNILNVLQGLPYVGPVLVYILKAIAIVTPIMTALSVCVQAVLAIPEIAARYKGSHELADNIKKWSDKIVYWLSYFSIRNAKKP